MDKQTMRSAIYQSLSTVLSEFTFRLKKTEEGFVRSKEGVKQTIGVPLFDYNPSYDFSITVCTRFERVEELFHLFSGSPSKYQSASYTSMTRLDYFTGKENSLFRVSSEEDVLTVITNLTPTIKDKIIPFFQDIGSLESLNKAFNNGTLPIDQSYHPSRGMHGIIISHLAGDNEFDLLTSFYLEEMKLLPVSEINKFTKLAAYLKTQNCSG